MVHLLVYDLGQEAVQALKRRAAEEGASVEEARWGLLRDASPKIQPELPFEKALLSEPADGDDDALSGTRW